MAISISRGPIVCMLLLLTNAPMWPTDAQVILPPNPNGGELTPTQINALLQNLGGGTVPGAATTIPTGGIQLSPSQISTLLQILGGTASPGTPTLPGPSPIPTSGIQALTPAQISTLLQILVGTASSGTATSSSVPGGPLPASGQMNTVPLNLGAATMPGTGSISSIPAGGIQPLTAAQAAAILQSLGGPVSSSPITATTAPVAPIPGPANVMNFGGTAASGFPLMTGVPGSLPPAATAPGITASPNSLLSILTGSAASNNNGVTTAGLSMPAGPAQSGVAGTQALFGGSAGGTIAAGGSSFAPDSSFVPTFGASFGPTSTGYYSLPSTPIKGYYYMARSAPTRPRYKSGFTGVFRSKKPRNFYHGYD
ncbi:nuclear pore complex protein NUP62 [Lingula anatina]|uniref:Nuclear pore complex protein NUP62 n=1 Tax=Lingula anatina TaxID=7574 RepID=A0A1S3HKV8_LINAN|nr:nuclear pore complex protein NUP62 [Lingula anatina]|eukprot:XP_013386745.1 nuclear pore complex protein NUP62 [Lingula anatina]